MAYPIVTEYGDKGGSIPVIGVILHTLHIIEESR